MIFQVGTIGFGGFEQMIQSMVNLGFFQFLFPFLLSLAIIYGVLAWGAKDRLPKSASGLIALILSFFVMLFAGANPGIVLFLQNLSGGFLAVASGILFLVILFGLMGFKVEQLFDKEKSSRWVFILAIILIVVVIFFGAGGALITPGAIPISSDFWTIIFFVVMLILVLWFLGRDKEAVGGAPPTK
jgi:hypothetical protein